MRLALDRPAPAGPEVPEGDPPLLLLPRREGPAVGREGEAPGRETAAQVRASSVRDEVPQEDLSMPPGRYREGPAVGREGQGTDLEQWCVEGSPESARGEVEDQDAG